MSPTDPAPKIEPGETVLEGGWIELGSRIVPDETTARIRRLIRTQLTQLAASPDGSSALFRDSADGRLWELTYPSGYFHGAGPPKLAVLGPAEAAERYPGFTG